jgi:hypothetical protein
MTEETRKSREPTCAIPSDGANFIVTIDGKPYAGFVNRACAEAAVGLWSGAVDGGGFAVAPDERVRHGWPAARGHLLEVVERSHGRHA